MAESMGVPASRAETAEEFHEQFAEAMKTKGPRFIDAKIESIEPLIVAKHRKAYDAAHAHRQGQPQGDLGLDQKRKAKV
jgi:thiamine pyrophosphate-dependent acetolactate synthase large subunit-like protein